MVPVTLLLWLLLLLSRVSVRCARSVSVTPRSDSRYSPHPLGVAGPCVQAFQKASWSSIPRVTTSRRRVRQTLPAFAGLERAQHGIT